MSIVGFDDVRFEAASELAKLHEQTDSTSNAKAVLQRAIELSRQSVFWHCRLIFQLAVSVGGDAALYICFYLSISFFFSLIFYLPFARNSL